MILCEGCNTNLELSTSSNLFVGDRNAIPNMGEWSCVNCERVLEANEKLYSVQQEDICRKLKELWLHLESKMPRAEEYKPGMQYHPSTATFQDFKDLDKTKENLTRLCWEMLNPSEKFEIDPDKFIKRP